MAEREIDEHLRDLRGEAPRESGGVFTLDYATALDKLRRYQSLDPTAAALRLVCAALALGAGRVEVDVDPGRLAVRSDARGPESSRLEQLFANLLEGDDEADAELAVGVNSLLGFGAREVTIQTLETRAEYRLDGQSVVARAGPGWSVTAWFYKPVTIAQARLGQACAHNIRPISVNGQPVNRPGLSLGRVFGEVVPAELAALDADVDGDSFYIEGESAGLARYYTEEMEPLSVGDRSLLPCRALVGLSTGSRAEAQVVFLQQGVHIGRARVPMYVPGVVALVDGCGLRRDLSGIGLVENEAYRRRLEWVGSLALQLFRRLSRAYPGLTLGEQLKAAQFGYR